MIAAVFFILAPRPPATRVDPLVPRRWWPDWKSGLLWRLGLMLGGVNAAYFSTNAFLPDFLNHLGRGDLIGPGLTALNVGQLPASFLLLALVGRLERQRRGLSDLRRAAARRRARDRLRQRPRHRRLRRADRVFRAAILILVLALPPLLSQPQDVPRMAAGMFTISYSCAVIVPIVSGLAWDATGIPATAFIPDRRRRLPHRGPRPDPAAA